MLAPSSLVIQNSPQEQAGQKAACGPDSRGQARYGPLQADYKSEPNEADLRDEADTVSEGPACCLKAEAAGEDEQAQATPSDVRDREVN